MAGGRTDAGGVLLDTAALSTAATAPAAARAGLDKPFSLYLDLVRIAAACAVVMAHFGYFRIFDDRQIARIADLGREAVIAFFVLSGFVIAYSAEQRKPTLREYVSARCARLYSVALPMLLLAFALAALAAGVLGTQVSDGYQLRKPWLYIPFHLLFLGELWGFVETPPWLLPYWSLNYEAWYYVLFGAVCYLKGRMRLLGAAVFALMGPKLWLLLPLWVSGVFLYRWQKTHRIGLCAARAGWSATLVLLAIWAWYDPEPALRKVALAAWPFSGMRMGSADRVLADYLVGMLVLANFACARHAGFGLLLRAARPIRVLSAHTFILYLSHSIVICACQALITFRRGDPAVLLGLALAIILAAAVLQPFTEVLQRRLRR
ncbi:acyltransferase family protein [Massilia aerilata]|uniref:Acyltransferase family protein n=1 Tax=Massilia aerilata TaxID=453817 RepID=A0ABW0RY27_9BURK